MRSRWAASGAASLLLLLAGCRSAPQPTAAAAPPDAVPTVPVLTVERGAIANRIEVTGQFRPWQEADLYAKVAGYLHEIRVDVGDRVRAGQVLATLEVPETQAELEQAAATRKRVELDVARASSDVERAKASLDLRRSTFDRLQAAAKARPRLIAQQELDDAASRLREAEAQLAAAEATRNAARQQVEVAQSAIGRVNAMLTFSTIVAPFDGVVTRRYVHPGAMIPAGTSSQTRPVVQIADIRRLRLVVPVPEAAIGNIRNGQQLSGEILNSTQTLTAAVARFTHNVDPSSRSMDVELDVANPSGAWMPGMFVKLLVPLEQSTAALWAPPDAVRQRDGASLLYAVKGDVLEERKVQTGIQSADRIEIRSGVAEGETIVAATGLPLRNGQRVRVRDAKR